jgi:hypothetical protein
MNNPAEVVTPESQTPQPNPQQAANTDDLVKTYIELRDIKAARKKKFTEEEDALNEALQQLAGVLELRITASGAESIKTASGTVYLSEKTMAMVEDWPPFYEFIKENNAFDMLYKRANAVPIVAHLEETGGLPPGVYIDRKKEVGVRKPTKKR